MKAAVAAAEMMMRLASSASESSLINDRESPRKWQSSAPPASCHDDRSWIIPTPDKWNAHTARGASARGRSNFCCPRNYWVNIINTSHLGTQPGREREKYASWRRVIEAWWVMTSWPLACEGVIHIFIYSGPIFFCRGSDYRGDPGPVQRSNNPIHIYYNIRQGLGGQAPLVIIKLVQRWYSSEFRISIKMF